MKYIPLQCCKCGRFIGKDGYQDVIYDGYSGGYEAGDSYCGPCGRAKGYEDKRITEPADAVNVQKDGRN